MKRTIVIRLLLALTLACVPFTSQATGPSTANISIEPVTYTDSGYILFKAYRHINYSGGYGDLSYASYWWLVVSAHGIWEEVPYKILQQPEGYAPEEKHDKFWKSVNQFRTEFDSPVNWARPPKSLQPLIRKYGFKPRPGFNKQEGQGTATWSLKSLCINNICSITPVPQRTLNFSPDRKTYNQVNGEVDARPVQCVFQHAGVALFKNGNIVNGEDEDPVDAYLIGAEFDFSRKENPVERVEVINDNENVHYYDGDLIDYQLVDAIGILPQPMLSK